MGGSALAVRQQRRFVAGTAILVAAANAAFIFYVANPDHREYEGALYLTTAALTAIGAVMAIPRASRRVGVSVVIGVITSWVVFYAVVFTLMSIHLPPGGTS